MYETSFGYKHVCIFCISNLHQKLHGHKYVTIMPLFSTLKYMLVNSWKQLPFQAYMKDHIMIWKKLFLRNLKLKENERMDAYNTYETT